MPGWEQSLRRSMSTVGWGLGLKIFFLNVPFSARKDPRGLKISDLRRRIGFGVPGLGHRRRATNYKDYLEDHGT